MEVWETEDVMIMKSDVSVKGRDVVLFKLLGKDQTIWDIAGYIYVCKSGY